MRVVRHGGPRAFLDRAEAWLLAREAENNLPLGIVGSVARGTDRYGSPLYFATVEQGDDVRGCAFRTPPYKLGLTRMPTRAIPLLAGDVAEVYDSIPAALGPNRVVRAFGAAWAALRGVRAVDGARQRIHVAEGVIAPGTMPPGAMRPATSADIPLVAGWLEAFSRETGLPEPGDPRTRARSLTGGDGGDSLLALWEDGAPVSMAGFPARTRHGVRIGYVYTPPRHRRRGYATALVSQVSRQILESGFSHCVLYTDLANPTSNGIYRRLGYRPLLDVMDVDFV